MSRIGKSTGTTVWYIQCNHCKREVELPYHADPAMHYTTKGWSCGSPRGQADYCDDPVCMRDRREKREAVYVCEGLWNEPNEEVEW